MEKATVIWVEQTESLDTDTLVLSLQFSQLPYSMLG